MLYQNKNTSMNSNVRLWMTRFCTVVIRFRLYFWSPGYRNV